MRSFYKSDDLEQELADVFLLLINLLTRKKGFWILTIKKRILLHYEPNKFNYTKKFDQFEYSNTKFLYICNQ